MGGLACLFGMARQLPAMTYIVKSHDAWGTAAVGEFPLLEQAREVFNALRNDRWFIADGGVKGLSDRGQQLRRGTHHRELQLPARLKIPKAMLKTV